MNASRTKQPRSSPIKILIVDDSRVFRNLVEKSLAAQTDMKVIGSVRNGIKALEFIHTSRPDIVTLDVEMPDMDGLETLKAIEAVNRETASLPPIGALMLSAHTDKGADATIKALEAGAFDFITKPVSTGAEESMDLLKNQLIAKIRLFTTRSSSVVLPVAKVQSLLRNRTEIQAIMIGISTGGPQALIKLLPKLCQKTDLPIFIAQHMPATFTQSLAKSLDNVCRFSVAEAQNDTKVINRCVYLAPGGRHLLLRRKGNEVYTVINDHPPENRCRPSVDILFRSAATIYKGNVIAMILTGMGEDGVKGMSTLKRAGAYTIAQDEASSVVWGMPGSAIASGNVDEVLALEAIPKALEKLL